MLPKLADSAITISLVPESREGDVKFWVELGASIMLDKPLIAVLLGDAPIPAKLALVADEIVHVSHGLDDPTSQADLMAAIQRVMGEDR
jgi:hypothetical protein